MNEKEEEEENEVKLKEEEKEVEENEEEEEKEEEKLNSIEKCMGLFPAVSGVTMTYFYFILHFKLEQNYVEMLLKKH